MTKDEEIQRFADFAETYPADSYLREWLLALVPQVRADLANDLIPTTSPVQLKELIIERAEQLVKRDHSRMIGETTTMKRNLQKTGVTLQNAMQQLEAVLTEIKKNL